MGRGAGSHPGRAGQAVGKSKRRASGAGGRLDGRGIRRRRPRPWLGCSDLRKVIKVEVMLPPGRHGVTRTAKLLQSTISWTSSRNGRLPTFEPARRGSERINNVQERSLGFRLSFGQNSVPSDVVEVWTILARFVGSRRTNPLLANLARLSSALKGVLDGVQNNIHGCIAIDWLAARNVSASSAVQILEAGSAFPQAELCESIQPMPIARWKRDVTMMDLDDRIWRSSGCPDGRHFLLLKTRALCARNGRPTESRVEATVAATAMAESKD